MTNDKNLPHNEDRETPKYCEMERNQKFDIKTKSVKIQNLRIPTQPYKVLIQDPSTSLGQHDFVPPGSQILLQLQIC